LGRNKQTQEQFVPWNEGAELIGVRRSTFFYYVEKGDIEELPGTRPRQGRYKLSDILAVKKKRERGKPRKAYTLKDKVIVDWLRSSDILVGLGLAHELYGEDVDLASASIYQSWRKNNDQITMAAFSPDRSKCLASIQVIPLPESVILDILSGKRAESDIQPDEIRTYDEPGPYILLVTSALVIPGRPDLLYQILYQYMDFWVKMYPERYIRKIYAQAVSERGSLLVSHFFMSPRYDLLPHTFELDLARPVASKIVRKMLIEKLIEKAPLPADLQFQQ